jgi:hypothetical protein
MDKETGLASDLVDGDAAPSIMDEQALLLRQQEKDAQIRRDRLQLQSDMNSRQTMLSKLKSMTGENAARQAMIKKIEDEVAALQQKLDSLPVVEEVPAPAEPAAAAQSLQDQLAQAEKEAAAIGLVDEFGNILYGKIGRGGRVSRGRGRGRPAGREGSRKQSMTLDNRPKALAVRGIPEQYVNEKMVRSHFQSFGEINRVVMGALGEPTTAVIEFKTRIMAELALSQGQTMLQHPLSLEWHEGQVSDANNAQVPSQADAAAVVEGISDDDDDEDVDRSWKR